MKTSHSNKIATSTGEKLFEVANIVFLILISLLALIPVAHVFAGSFSSSNAIMQNRVAVWPVEFTLDNFRFIMKTSMIWSALWMTIKVVIIGTAINMFLTILTSYPLSKLYLRGRKFLMLFVVLTIIFQAPLIPTYLVVKELGMLNSMWALIIPSAVAAFNMLLCITFFRGLPEELFDAARVDGMSEYRIVWSIVTPLSLPIIVTLILFYAVGHWNNYFMPLLYINDRTMQTLQMYLYFMISEGNNTDMVGAAASEAAGGMLPQAIQMSVIVIATFPIVVLYPFIQKHFIKGATLGSLKG